MQSPQFAPQANPIRITHSLIQASINATMGRF